MIRRRSSLLRRVVAFGALAAVALAFVLARPSRTAPPRTEFPALFSGFDPAAVASLRIERTTKRDGKETKNEVVLERTGSSAWVLGNRGGYPAKTSQVARFLDEVRDARAKTENTRDPSKAKAFAGDDGYVEVTVTGTNKETLARFGIGKSGAGGSFDEAYVRVGEPADDAAAAGRPVGVARASATDFRVVTVTGLDAHVRAEPEDWIDRDLWPALSGSDLVGLEIDQREKGRSIVLVKEEKKPEPPKEGEPGTPPAPAAPAADVWRMEKPTAGPASPSAASATAGAFANLSIEALVAPREGATDADYGFDEPSLVVAGKGRLLAGVEEAPAYVLTVGKKVEGKDASYVRRGVDSFVFEVSEGSLREFKNDPDSWAEKKPDEKKPDEKKPDEGKPEDAKPGDAPKEPGPGGAETPPGDEKPGETPPGKPEDGKPGEPAPPKDETPPAPPETPPPPAPPPPGTDDAPK